MSQKIKIHINDKEIIAKEGEFILPVALKNGFDIPYFCFHPDLPTDGSCRACLVEVVDEKRGNWITTSCTLQAKNGMKILLDTDEVASLRRENMELLFAGHKKNCQNCKEKYPCRVCETIEKYGLQYDEYEKNEELEELEIHKMGTAAEFDPKMCIDCNRCVRMCEDIGIGFLRLGGKASEHRITYNRDPDVDCIYCGQCTVACPVYAIREQSHIKEVLEVLENPDKFVIIQTAPSVRGSIGEEFGMGYSVNCEGKLNTAYRMIGFDKVFDVNFGADITTMIEAEEFVERLNHGGKKGIGYKLPMFTSCCPGWVKCAEFYYPELLPNLTTARSPQIHSGGAYKTWWAEREGIDPEKIVVVSSMPCTSKKYECNMDSLNVNGLRPVDYVLTTRELATIMKIKNIDLPKLKESKSDELGQYSGAGAIYGASGGVMESALRTAYKNITSKNLPKLDLKEVRTGTEAYKTAEIDIEGKKIRVAIVATPKQVKKIIEELRKNPDAYHYVEVMACAGGCIGGGGQPHPSTKAIIEERRKVLYNIDKEMQIRTAHGNPIVQEFMSWVSEKEDKELKHSLYHREFKRKEKFE